MPFEEYKRIQYATHRLRLDLPVGVAPGSLRLLWRTPQLLQDARVSPVRPPSPEEGAPPEKPKRPSAWAKFNKLPSFNPLVEPSIAVNIW
jgi:hypothetical protein